MKNYKHKYSKDNGTLSSKFPIVKKHIKTIEEKPKEELDAIYVSIYKSLNNFNNKEIINSPMVKIISIVTTILRMDDEFENKNSEVDKAKRKAIEVDEYCKELYDLIDQIHFTNVCELIMVLRMLSKAYNIVFADQMYYKNVASGKSLYDFLKGLYECDKINFKVEQLVAYQNLLMES